MDNWKRTNRLRDISLFKITEKGLNRIMKHALEEGIVIISTARSVVVPRGEDESSYDFGSWQSLFEDYVDFCDRRGLPICEEDVPRNLDVKSLEHEINSKGYLLNRDSEEKFLEERNDKCDRELYSYLKGPSNPYNFTATYGGYQGPTGEIGDYEPSFIIYNNVNKSKRDNFSSYGWEDLYKRALAMCQRYKQDSVYVQAPGKDPVYVDMGGNKVNTSESSNFTFNQKDSFFTTTKRKKSSVGKKDEDPSKRGVDPHTFTADIGFEEISESLSLRPRTPSGFSGRVKSKSLGEIWDPENF